MKNLKKYIMITIGVIIIIVMIILLREKRIRKNADISLSDPDNGPQGILEEDNEKDEKFELETVRNRFFVIKTCINKYNNNIKELYAEDNPYAGNIDNDFKIENASYLCKMLSDEAIRDLNITNENVYDKLKGGNMHISKLYVKELSDNISEYVALRKIKSI